VDVAARNARVARLLTAGPLTRNQIAERLGLPTGAAARALSELRKADQITLQGTPPHATWRLLNTQ